MSGRRRGTRPAARRRLVTQHAVCTDADGTDREAFQLRGSTADERLGERRGEAGGDEGGARSALPRVRARRAVPRVCAVAAVEGRRWLEKRLASVGVPHDNFVRREGADHPARNVVLHCVGPVSRLEQPRARQERKRGDDHKRQGRGCDAGRGDGVRQAEHAGAEDEVDGEVEDASGGLILHSTTNPRHGRKSEKRI